jgi:hypothetical protein
MCSRADLYRMPFSSQLRMMSSARGDSTVRRRCSRAKRVLLGMMALRYRSGHTTSTYSRSSSATAAAPAASAPGGGGQTHCSVKAAVHVRGVLPLRCQIRHLHSCANETVTGLTALGPAAEWAQQMGSTMSTIAANT